MKCQIQTTEIRAGWYRHHCPKCRLTVESPGARLVRSKDCPGPKDGPGIVQKARELSAAMAKWVSAGMPMRSQERINEILEHHCKPCQYYKNGECRLCGCPVSESGFRNKLLCATESCPDQPPKWLAEVSSC